MHRRPDCWSLEEFAIDDIRDDRVAGVRDHTPHRGLERGANREYPRCAPQSQAAAEGRDPVK